MSPEELQSCFDGLIALHKLDVRVNDPSFKPTGLWALDVEHDEQGGFVGCGFYNGGVSHYITNIVLLNSIDVHALSLICHNGVSDFDCLRSWGIDVKDTQLLWDTGLVSHILDSSRAGYGLKKLAEADLNIVYPSYDDIVGRKTLKQVKERKTLDKWPTSLVASYNAMDTFVTWKLYLIQKEQLKDNGLFVNVERPLAFILSQMEARGVCVDLDYLRVLRDTLEAQRSPIELQIKNELGSINLNSPRQLLEALNAKEIYPSFKGKPSTDKRALTLCQSHGVVSSLLRYSELDTLLSSFVTPYLERNQSIVHPWFNQCGTRTGRLSCSNPNLLQIPRRTENGKRVRRMFVPRPGMLMGDADYGQIEPRVMAHLSKDPSLCGLFNRGENFHEYTRLRLGFPNTDEGYAKAKVLNLSVGYRASKYSVQRQLGGTLEEAQEQIDRWWGLFPALRRWQDRLVYDSKRSNFCTTLLGRRIKIDGLSDGNPWKREAAERQLINNITQGSAAEIMKMAMIRLSQDSRLSKTFGLLVQVYDELLFESANILQDVAIVQDCMTKAIALAVPLTVDCKTGENWSEVH